MSKHETREAWLQAATEVLRRTVFKRHDATIPAVRVSVGFPGGAGNKRKAIGQCWVPDASEDKVGQIFISPVLGTGFEAIDTLTHELVHACTPGEGHKGEFKRIALRIGLVGKMTSAGAGEALAIELRAIMEKLGEYPHAKLTPANPGKKQSTRLIKLECEDCGYVARTTQKWLDDAGALICPCNGQPLEVAS